MQYASYFHSLWFRGRNYSLVNGELVNQQADMEVHKGWVEVTKLS